MLERNIKPTYPNEWRSACCKKKIVARLVANKMDGTNNLSAEKSAKTHLQGLAFGRVLYVVICATVLLVYGIVGSINFDLLHPLQLGYVFWRFCSSLECGLLHITFAPAAHFNHHLLSCLNYCFCPTNEKEKENRNKMRKNGLEHGSAKFL
jgi:hypothetical protein